MRSSEARRGRRNGAMLAMVIVAGLGGCATGGATGRGRSAAVTSPSGMRVSTSASSGAPSPRPQVTPPQVTPSAAATANSAPAAFRSSVTKITATDVPYTWRTGCPVAPAALRRLQMSYWGFDDRAHTGTMIVNAAVADDVVRVFKQLYAARFPIRRMEPVDAFKGSDPKSMAADNTSGFNCRYAVAPGPKSWSVHAYGEAIDVNTVENPYLEGGTVMPAAGKAYVNRAKSRPGMAVKGGVLIKAFASVGWKWGGRWTGAPDYQHFSKTGG